MVWWRGSCPQKLQCVASVVWQRCVFYGPWCGVRYFTGSACTGVLEIVTGAVCTVPVFPEGCCAGIHVGVGCSLCPAPNAVVYPNGSALVWRRAGSSSKAACVPHPTIQLTFLLKVVTRHPIDLNQVSDGNEHSADFDDAMLVVWYIRTLHSALRYLGETVIFLVFDKGGCPVLTRHVWFGRIFSRVWTLDGWVSPLWINCTHIKKQSSRNGI